MRKTMMATASAFALAFGAAALAADAGTGAAAGADGDVLEQQQTGATEADTGTGDALAMPEMGGASYADLDDDARESIGFGVAQDGWEADEVIGATVVDADGEAVGEIEDLLIGENEAVDRAVLRVSADQGGGERHVVVRLDELQRAEGDDALELTLVRTAVDGDYFMGESSFEKVAGRWEPSSL